MEIEDSYLTRLLASARSVERQDWLLVTIIIMQAMMLYYAFNAADQAEGAWYAAADAQDSSRSCAQALFAAEKAASNADAAATVCRIR